MLLIMTQLDFISGMKRLSSYYFKELTNDQLVIWYEMFKDVSIDDFNQALKEISRESQYMPNANILLEKCSQINIRNISRVVQFMYEDGYFHKGVERLSDEQANRNFDKTMMWIEKGIIPSFLEDDINSYLVKYKQSKLDNKERLKLQC